MTRPETEAESGRKWAGLKAVAVQGEKGDDWAMYIGPSNWSDSHTVAWGNKLPESVARALVAEGEFVPSEELADRFIAFAEWEYRP